MKQPNIIFIFTDQQHWHAAGHLDPYYITPGMDALAADGAVFTRAYCSTPQCSPSRSSLMTGYYPHKTGVMGNIGAAGGNHLTMDTIGKKLQAAGYYTGYFGKWHIGTDVNGTAGWDEEEGVTEKRPFRDAGLAEKSIRFIDTATEKNQPFALYISINNPHDIYQYAGGKRLEEDISTDLPDSYVQEDFSTVPSVQKQFMDEDQGRVMADKDDEGWKEYRKLYRSKVKLADDILHTVTYRLKEKGLYDDALVIFTSDHGDMDTHNHLVYKGPFMYDHMLRVPLIIKRPGVKKGTDTGGMTINTDLVPTILDYAGLPVDGYDGNSLRPLLEDRAEGTGRDFIIAQYYSKQKWVNPIRTIITEKYKYNRYIEHGEELYDLEDDPGEVKNLAAVAAFTEVKRKLRLRLDAWIADNKDPFDSLSVTDRNGEKLI